MSESATERRRAAATAGHRGEVEIAVTALNDVDPRVRIAGLRSLARLNKLEDKELAVALADPKSEVRIASLELAAQRAAPDIRAALFDEDAMVVESAAWALGERRDTQAVGALSTLATSHAEALVRESAVAALGAIGHRDGLPAVLSATTDKPSVRRRAVICLSPFEGPEVDAAFDRARKDKDRQVRDAVDELLGPAES